MCSSEGEKLPVQLTQRRSRSVRDRVVYQREGSWHERNADQVTQFRPKEYRRSARWLSGTWSTHSTWSWLSRCAAEYGRQRKDTVNSVEVSLLPWLRDKIAKTTSNRNLANVFPDPNCHNFNSSSKFLPRFGPEKWSSQITRPSSVTDSGDLLGPPPVAAPPGTIAPRGETLVTSSLPPSAGK